MNAQSVIQLEAGEGFVFTPEVKNIARRGLVYLDAGYPIHLTGPAGMGKTTLALHLAGKLGRPAVLVYGDEDFGSSDLIGGEKGMVSKRVVDNFIHSVLKTEDSVKKQWVDQRVTTACRNGYTLIYDEFSRSHAETNNVLLSILEEGLVALPQGRSRESYIRVHPKFRAIFTSNPDEYAGVFTPPSALLDRMITIRMDNHDPETEAAIVESKSGLSRKEARKVVNILTVVRNAEDTRVMPTLRAGIMIGKILHKCEVQVRHNDPVLWETCKDVLADCVPDAERLRQLITMSLTPQAIAS